MKFLSRLVPDLGITSYISAVAQGVLKAFTEQPSEENDASFEHEDVIYLCPTEYKDPLEQMFDSFRVEQLKLLSINTRKRSTKESTEEELKNQLAKRTSEVNKIINRARILCRLAGVKKPEDLTREKAIEAACLFGELPKLVTTHAKAKKFFTQSKDHLLMAIKFYPDEPGYTQKTKYEYASAASKIFKWAEKYLNSDNSDSSDNSIRDYWSDIVKKRAIGEESKKNKRHPYTEAELKKIFGHKVYKKGKIGFSHRTKKFCLYQYWLPILSLVLGLRGNEAAQLHRSDIICKFGKYYIHVNNSHVGQSLKNPNANRYLLVSDILIRLGFLNFIDLYKNDERLFPELKHYTKDGYYKNAGEWFRRTFKGQFSEKKCFHSFRHCFVDVLFEKELAESKASELVGHAQQSITFSVYGGKVGFEEIARNQSLVDFSQVLKHVVPFTQTNAYKVLSKKNKVS